MEGREGMGLEGLLWPRGKKRKKRRWRRKRRMMMMVMMILVRKGL